MQDPHVVSLRYRLESAENISFDNPPPIEVETASFRARLENSKLKVEPREHFPSLEAARKQVDEFLRAWELDDALRHGKPEIRFKFVDSDVIDRNPTPPSSPVVLDVTGSAHASWSASGTLSITRRQYPEPPKLFTASPDVETLWQRFEGYRNGREFLLAMAYFNLTVIEDKGGAKGVWKRKPRSGNRGRRGQAAKLYRIDMEVLDKLGELTATRGDLSDARKIDSQSTLLPLSPAEVAWIEAAMKAIIRRVGEFNSGASLPLITMRDLPEL